MINNIFELDNKTVSDIMTHRTNIVAIPIHCNLKETLHFVNTEKYTRFPVYEENIDHIVGILHVKDLFRFIENGDKHTFSLRDMVREPYYVLESMRIDYLFRDMQKNNVHLSIALDEYGGTEGIVTMEDLLEEIVGNIFDEYDEPDLEIADIETIDEYTFFMAGTINLGEVEDFLRIDLPTEDYDTLSGFLIGQLGYFPAPEERSSVVHENIIFSVEEMNDRRIVKVKVSMKNPSEEEL